MNPPRLLLIYSLPEGPTDETQYSSRQICLIGGVVFVAFTILVIAFGAGSIKRDATRRADQILLLEGHRWAKTDPHGRGMAIVGAAASEAAGAAAVHDDWSVRRAWVSYTIAPPLKSKPLAKATSLTPTSTSQTVQASGPPIRDATVCQGAA
jgi:hypothetical protein